MGAVSSTPKLRSNKMSECKHDGYTANAECLKCGKSATFRLLDDMSHTKQQLSEARADALRMAKIVSKITFFETKLTSEMATVLNSESNELIIKYEEQ
jgi:hypothetical protein